ncbi:hypothetical protein BP6252_05454 [Coleophoma cylindrospora]|uniref:RRM domain-containing protein n=1 Tax=Coleophoma cylindrospora TaxID=1849047 RepID=A0A3D8RUC8_9HELO|nr:hypothetical protein BP6252_05454 [Coleophoma cylindrospora]
MSPTTPDTSGTMTSIRAEGAGTAGSSADAKPATMTSYDDGHDDGIVSESGDEAPGGVLLHDIGALSLEDDNAVDVTIKSTGRYSINAAKRGSSSSKGFTPGGTKRYTHPFVRNSGRRDDPFAFTPSKTKRTSGGSFKSAEKESLMSRNWRSGSDRSGSSSNGSNGHALVTHDGREISGNNAQAYYPPAYCIFVANLLATASDEVLTASVTEAFRKYGQVFVKVRRDNKGMPYSFAQFTCQRHANEAMIFGNGKMINGRACRIEQTNANRMYYICKKNGSSLEASEAKQILGIYGKVTTWNTSVLEQQYQNLGPGVIAYFDLFETGRMACQTFSNHPLYAMHLVAPNKSPNAAALARADAESRVFLEKYEVDRRSVFVGNLPVGVSEYDIAGLFSEFGSIRNVHVMDQPSKHPEGGQYFFAFVEFTTIESAQRATANMDRRSYLGKTLRVAAKDSSHGRKIGLASAPSSFVRRHPSADTFQSPAPRRRSEQERMPLSVPSPVHQAVVQYPPPPPPVAQSYANFPVSYQQYPEWNPFLNGLGLLQHPGYGYATHPSPPYPGVPFTPYTSPGPSSVSFMSGSPGYPAAGASQYSQYAPQYQLPTPPQWAMAPQQVAAPQPESGEAAPVKGGDEEVAQRTTEHQ